MSKLYRYKVSPFSGTDYHKHASLVRAGFDQCAICGRPVKRPAAHKAVVINGGSAWGDSKSDEDDPGYMGLWSVGPDCHKRLVESEVG